MASAVSPAASNAPRVHTRGISAFAVAIASGAALEELVARTSRPSHPARSAERRRARGRFPCARAALKRMPVRNSSRAAERPIFASAYGEITAGRMPSFTSVNPNTALSSATTMSQTAASPAPPPSAAPWTRPIERHRQRIERREHPRRGIARRGRSRHACS